MPRTADPRMADPNAEKWYRAMARRSKITADVNYRRLRAFCRQMKIEPAAIVSMAERQKELRDLLADFVDQEVAKGRTTWYIHSTVIAVKSWLKFMDAPLRLQVELPRNVVSKRTEDERVPTVDELRSAFLTAKPHVRIVLALMAFSGLRPGAIGSYEGNDGLRLKDLPELHYVGDGCRSAGQELHAKGRAIFEKVPTLVRVRTSSSKAGHQYLTFLGEEGCGYVSQYLETRLAQKESFTPDTDLAHSLYAEKSFLRSLNITSRVHRVFRAAGIVDRSGKTPRPYVLRRYFLNRCLEAQSKVGVPDRYVEFWAGHTGDVTAKHYTTGLPNLPESVIEEMRSAYKRCEPFLSTVPSKKDTQTQANIAKVLLTGLGYTEKELAGVDFDNLDPAEFQDLVQKKVAVPAAPRQKQKVVDAEELPRYLEEGWTAVMTLGGDRVVLSPPGS